MTRPEFAPRVLIAPDKFKGTLTAREAAEAIAVGVRAEWPAAVITSMPFADGGEGTVDAVVAAGGRPRHTMVAGPLGEEVDARWAIMGDTAVVEMAQSSGLQLVDPSPTTARKAHTEGLGALILAALEEGVARIVIGVGGSASTDGGMGALRALGAVFLDERGSALRGSGEDLRHVAEIDLEWLDPRLRTVDLLLCSDVSNPFAGAEGAASIFGPQKGADSATIAELDLGLRVFAAALARATGVNPIDDDWGGSGGGVAGGMRAACGAHAGDGVDIVADLVGLDAALGSQDLVIVGEGSIDLQSAMGKTPVGVARHARRVGVPAAAVVGRNLLQTDHLLTENIIAISAAIDSAPTLDDALRDPAPWTTAAARQLLKRLQNQSLTYWSPSATDQRVL
jgi:glycerate kinase